MERKKKTGRILTNIILVIAIAVFLFSGYQLYRAFSEYQKGVHEYKGLQEIAFGIDAPEGKKGDSFRLRNVDFAALQKINPDIVGWLQFEEPSTINYPIVQGKDNDQYLHTTFERKQNASGTLFMDKDHAGDFSDVNTFIYGHNMKNGSMFGKLRKYKKSSFRDKYPYFYIHRPDGKIDKYEVFAVSVVKDMSDSYQKWFDTQEEFASYIKHVRDVSLYPTEVEVSQSDRIVSLSTCTNVTDDERLLVQGVLVTEAE